MEIESLLERMRQVSAMDLDSQEFEQAKDELTKEMEKLSPGGRERCLLLLCHLDEQRQAQVEIAPAQYVSWCEGYGRYLAKCLEPPVLGTLGDNWSDLRRSGLS